ncbi:MULTISPECIES: CobW family GTP-binding protein [Alphaproteobacteria]|uniref:ATP-binding protein n=2 Tax=Alphaproteobacteria TaxID=28211 RepID=A0A512HLG0_9HYPH|nr:MULTISPECIES: GTP-binding protein [Alphaproteobacteria]GEO86287.1 ATP-binding protein [Ciceribacter naphthalenivorans]GLR21769.1 ATP-binding protein [Ciceribacter naphthalenivorans]GLT04625.1 ATP-binding protein [Sphingomonas psychrolutea]
MSDSNGRIPVSIITGFLGAGKSTLLNRILKDPAMKDAAVIINEFGEVGIDHMLVEASNDSIVELADGCLCCTVRGELVDTLAELIDGIQTGRLKRLSRVVIETTGLADPAPVMQSVIGHPALAQSFDLDGVVTVVDMVHGLSTLDTYPEAVRQVAVADRLVLTKASLADPAAREALLERLRMLNPLSEMTDGDTAEVGTAAILANGLYDPTSKIADVDRWLKDEARADHDHHHHGHDHDHHHAHDPHCEQCDHEGHTPDRDGHHHEHHHHDHGHDVNRHDDRIRSYSIVHDRPIEPMALDMFIDILRSSQGEKLLRMKAVVALTDRPNQPLVLHGVQSVFHPPVRLPAWPDPEDRRTRLVLITRDLDESYVRELFDAFTGRPQIDRPDRLALEDNPLAIPGMKM